VASYDRERFLQRRGVWGARKKDWPEGGRGGGRESGGGGCGCSADPAQISCSPQENRKEGRDSEPASDHVVARSKCGALEEGPRIEAERERLTNRTGLWAVVGGESAAG